MVPLTLLDPHELSLAVIYHRPLPTEDGLLALTGCTSSVLTVRLQHQVRCLHATGIVAAMRDLHLVLAIEIQLGFEILVAPMSHKIRNCRGVEGVTLVRPPETVRTKPIATVVVQPDTAMTHKAIPVRFHVAEQPGRVIHRTLRDLKRPDGFVCNFKKMLTSVFIKIANAMQALIEGSTKGVECFVFNVGKKMGRHCYLSNKRGTAYSRENSGITSGQVVFD